MKLFLFQVFFVLFLPTLAIAEAKFFTGKVVAVKDGDTIEVLDRGRAVTIRLAGIDCPERGYPFSDKAREFVSRKAYKREVRVVAYKKGKYGRLISDVVLESRENLSHLLVREGLCFWYRKYSPNDFRLQNLENAARKEAKGVWSLKNPVPPWETRK